MFVSLLSIDSMAVLNSCEDFGKDQMWFHSLGLKKLPLQLVYFEETRKSRNFAHELWLIFLTTLTYCFHHGSEIFLPIGSSLREWIKAFLKRLRGFNS